MPNSARGEQRAIRSAVMRYGNFLPNQNPNLDALVAAVLQTILGLTPSFFIQVLADLSLILGHKPALNLLGLEMQLVMLARAGFFDLRSCLLSHLSRGIDAETVHGYRRHPLGLPLALIIRKKRISKGWTASIGPIRMEWAVVHEMVHRL